MFVEFAGYGAYCFCDFVMKSGNVWYNENVSNSKIWLIHFGDCDVDFLNGITSQIYCCSPWVSLWIRYTLVVPFLL